MSVKIITVEQYHAGAYHADLTKGRGAVSPGYVASAMGISRQAVHDAIKRGTLDAIRVIDSPERGNTVALFITVDALTAYQQRKELRELQQVG